MFVPSKSKSALGCLTTEPVSGDAVSRNRNLEDTHYRYINFAGGCGEGMSVESTETKNMKFITLVSRWL